MGLRAGKPGSLFVGFSQGKTSEERVKNLIKKYGLADEKKYVLIKEIKNKKTNQWYIKVKCIEDEKK